MADATFVIEIQTTGSDAAIKQFDAVRQAARNSFNDVESNYNKIGIATKRASDNIGRFATDSRRHISSLTSVFSQVSSAATQFGVTSSRSFLGLISTIGQVTAAFFGLRSVLSGSFGNFSSNIKNSERDIKQLSSGMLTAASSTIIYNESLKGLHQAAATSGEKVKKLQEEARNADKEFKNYEKAIKNAKDALKSGAIDQTTFNKVASSFKDAALKASEFRDNARLAIIESTKWDNALIAVSKVSSGISNLLATLGKLPPAFYAAAAAATVFGLGFISFIKKGIAAINEMQSLVIQYAAIVATKMSGDLPISEKFKQATAYAQDLYIKFLGIQGTTLATVDELTQGAVEMAKWETIIDSSEKGLKEYATVMNALLISTKGQQNVQMQIREEIRDLMTGQIRAYAQLAMIMKSIDPQLQRNLEHHIKMGTQMEYMNKLLSGYAEAGQVISEMYSAQEKRLQSIISIITMGITTDIYKEIVSIMKEIGDWLMKHKEVIISIGKLLVGTVWSALKLIGNTVITILSVFWDLVKGPLKYFTYGLTVIASTIKVIFELLSRLFIHVKNVITVLVSSFWYSISNLVNQVPVVGKALISDELLAERKKAFDDSIKEMIKSTDDLVDYLKKSANVIGEDFMSVYNAIEGLGKTTTPEKPKLKTSQTEKEALRQIKLAEDEYKRQAELLDSLKKKWDAYFDAAKVKGPEFLKNIMSIKDQGISGFQILGQQLQNVFGKEKGKKLGQELIDGINQAAASGKTEEFETYARRMDTLFKFYFDRKKLEAELKKYQTIAAQEAGPQEKKTDAQDQIRLIGIRLEALKRETAIRYETSKIEDTIDSIMQRIEVRENSLKRIQDEINAKAGLGLETEYKLNEELLKEKVLHLAILQSEKTRLEKLGVAPKYIEDINKKIVDQKKDIDDLVVALKGYQRILSDLQGMGMYSGKFEEASRLQLDLQARLAEQRGEDPVRVARWKAEEIKKLEADKYEKLAYYSKTYEDAALNSSKEYFYKLKNEYQMFGDLVKGTYDTLSESMQSRLLDVVEGRITKFKDFFKEFCKDILLEWYKMLQKMAMNQILAMALRPLVEGTGGFSLFKLFGGSSGMFFHGGGTVGFNGEKGNVSPLAFAGAPRLHNGLYGDEYPAILKAGEKVIPAGKSDSPKVQVVIQNNSSAQVKQTDEAPRFDGKKWVVSTVLEDIANGGPTYKAIRGLK